MEEIVARLEARIKSLEAENEKMKVTTSDAVAAINATPKTKNALEEEEAEIHKGTAKMQAKTPKWPVQAVENETGLSDQFTNLLTGMMVKAKTSPPEIKAFTGLLELEGDLVSFISAMAEGTFGNEDVRAMVANGLKSYATAFIAKKIVESEGELMKLVAKNEMPGTAVGILSKVKDQIATARSPKAPTREYKTLADHAATATTAIQKNSTFLKAAAVNQLGLTDAVKAGNAAVEQEQINHVKAVGRAAATEAAAVATSKETAKIASDAHAATTEGIAEKVKIDAQKQIVDAAKLKSDTESAAAAAIIKERTDKIDKAKANADAATARANDAIAKVAADKAAIIANAAADKEIAAANKIAASALKKSSGIEQHENLKTEVATTKQAIEDAKMDVANSKIQSFKTTPNEMQSAAQSAAQSASQAKLDTAIQDAKNAESNLSASRSANRTRKYLTNPLKRVGKNIIATPRAVASGIYNAPSNVSNSINSSLERQKADYLERTKTRRKQLMEAAKIAGNVMSKTADTVSKSALEESANRRAIEEETKLEKELEKETLELDEMRNTPTNPPTLYQQRLKSKESLVNKLIKVVEQKKNERIDARLSSM